MCALLQKNPQSNAVCERMHQTVGNVLRALLHGNPPQNIVNAAQYVDEALSLLCMPCKQEYPPPLAAAQAILFLTETCFSTIH